MWLAACYLEYAHTPTAHPRGTEESVGGEGRARAGGRRTTGRCVCRHGSCRRGYRKGVTRRAWLERRDREKIAKGELSLLELMFWFAPHVFLAIKLLEVCVGQLLQYESEGYVKAGTERFAKRFTASFTGRFTERFWARFTERFTARFTVRFTVRFTERFTEPFMGIFTGRFTGRFTARFTARFTTRFTERFTERFTDQFPEPLTERFTEGYLFHRIVFFTDVFFSTEGLPEGFSLECFKEGSFQTKVCPVSPHLHNG